MVEPGSLLNPESDDPQALNQSAPEFVEAEAEVEADVDVDAQGELEAAVETATPGGFDKFRATAGAAAGWGLEKAGAAAVQGANLARAYPRATLASGLSALVLGGVLAISPSKKPLEVEIPRPGAQAESKAKVDAKADPEAVVKPEVPPSQTESERVAGTGPGDDASNPTGDEPTPSADPAPVAEPAPHTASLLGASGDPDPTPPAEPPVKLTAGVEEAPLPDLPEVDAKADAPQEPAAEPPPAIAEAAALGAATQLAKAGPKPSDPPLDVAAAPAPLPTPESPAPTPADVAAAPAPLAAPENPAPTLADVAAAPSPEAAPAPLADAAPAPSVTPVEPADHGLPLAAPAPVVAAGAGAGAVAKAATVGAAGLGAAAVGVAIKGIGSDEKAEPPAPLSSASPLDPAPPSTAAVEGFPPVMAAEPTPTPAEPPTPPSAPASAPLPSNPTPVASSTPSMLPALGAVPEVAPATTADRPASTVDAGPVAKAEPKPEAEHPDWVPLRRSGDIVAADIDRDGLEDDPFESDDRADQARNFDVKTFPPSNPIPSQSGLDAPAAATASAARSTGKLDTVLHKVEPGENFYTIAQNCYGSGRYYRALGKVNADKFKRMEDLYVGAVIRVPPPEDLDPAYIDPPGTRYGSKAGSGGKPSQTTKSADASNSKGGTQVPRSRRSEVELNLPVSDSNAEFTSKAEGRPASPPVARRRPLDSDDETDRERDRYEPEAASRSVSTRPVHKVQPDETLRTIARDRLGSGRRAGEILELNRETIDDPSDLIVGQILELPDDARVARSRSRR